MTRNGFGFRDGLSHFWLQLQVKEIRSPWSKFHPRWKIVDIGVSFGKDVPSEDDVPMSGEQEHFHFCMHSIRTKPWNSLSLERLLSMYIPISAEKDVR